MDDAIAEKLQAQSDHRESMTQADKIVRELRSQIESLSSHVENAESVKAKALDELSIKYGAQQKLLEEEIDSLRKQVDSLTEAQKRTEGAENSALRELDITKAQLNGYLKEIQELKELVEELKQGIKDKDEEHQIEEKKRNAIVKELKAQLKKEALRVKDLDAALKAARDELKQPKRSSIHKAHLVGPAPQPSMVMSLTRRGSNPLAPGKGSSPFNIRPNSLSPDLRGSGESAESSSPQEIENMMTSSAPPVISIANADGEESSVNSDSFQGMITEKFTRLQKQNFVLQEKIQYLEESIQKLTSELEKKRGVVNNLIKRIDTGALPANASTTRVRQLFRMLDL
jgi:chromosome segregation ATPase